MSARRQQQASDVAPRPRARPPTSASGGGDGGDSGNKGGSGGPTFGMGVLLGGLAVAAAGAIAGAIIERWPWSKSAAPAGEAETAGGAPGPASDDCVLCLCEPRTHAFVPCGHLACCTKCAREHVTGGARLLLTACPVCRAPLRGAMILRVYK